MKLIIAGSRTIKGGAALINSALNLIEVNSDLELGEYMDLDFPRLEIVHGGCSSGPDAAAEIWYHEYVEYCKTRTKFEPDWKRHGKAAGPIRNRQMANYADTLLLIWDGKSKGSKNMKEEMEKLNKPVYEIIIKG